MSLKSVETAVNQLLGPIADRANAVVFAIADIGGFHFPVVVAFLAVAAVAMTFWLGFVNIRGFPHAIRLVRGDYAHSEDDGEVSQFGALSAALAGTVGVGNVAGVALAISLGGPGAVFWMTLTGVFGMSLKFAECALAVRYRTIAPDGVVNGGPMHYIPVAFARIGLRPLGVILAAVFALATLFASTSLFQVNQAFVQIRAVTGPQSPLVFGLLFALGVGVVIVGGMKGIARLSTRLVPALVLVYFLSAAVVLIARASALPHVVLSILADALQPHAFAGGLTGALVVGVQRAVFAAESGLGSAAIAHATARTDEPISEGFVALFEPFVSTAFVCNLTALVILAAGPGGKAAAPGGVELASRAFQAVIPGFAPVLAVIVAILAFKTVVAWAYYGERAWGWLVGEGPRKRIGFRLAFLCAIAVAPILTPLEAIRFLDAMVFAMAVPNLLALGLLGRDLRRDLARYWAAVGSGQIARRPRQGATSTSAAGLTSRARAILSTIK